MNEITEYYDILKEYIKAKKQLDKILKNITDKYLKKIISIMKFVEYEEIVPKEEIYGDDEIIHITTEKDVFILYIRYGVLGCIFEYEIKISKDIFKDIDRIYNSLFELEPEKLKEKEWYKKLRELNNIDDDDDDN